MNDTPIQNEQDELSTDIVQNHTADEIPNQIERINISLDVVWQGGAGKYDSRMSEISLESCFIDSMGQETLGETITFNVTRISLIPLATAIIKCFYSPHENHGPSPHYRIDWPATRYRKTCLGRDARD